MQKILTSLLGNLLLQFGLIDESEIELAQRLRGHTGLPIGKCLILLDTVSDLELSAALEAQALIRTETIDLETFRRAMDIVVRQNWSLSDALTALSADAHPICGTRLGDILLAAEALNSSQLGFALEAANVFGMPLGKVLIGIDVVAEQSLQEALFLQIGIRRGTVTRDTAVSGLKAAHRSRREERKISMPHKLSDLLAGSGIITDSHLASTRNRMRDSFKPLGQCLLEDNVIGIEMLASALCLQNLVAEGGISLRAACTILMEISLVESSVPKLSKLRPFLRAEDARFFTFYDFLRTSGFLSAWNLERLSTMLAVPTRSLKFYFGQSELLRAALIKAFPEDRSIVNAAFILHHLTLTGRLTPHQALLAFAFRMRGLQMSQGCALSA